MDYRRMAERAAITIISTQSGYCDLDDPVTVRFVDLLAIELKSAILAEREECVKILAEMIQERTETQKKVQSPLNKSGIDFQLIILSLAENRIRARSQSAPQSPEIAPGSPENPKGYRNYLELPEK